MGKTYSINIVIVIFTLTARNIPGSEENQIYGIYYRRKETGPDLTEKDSMMFYQRY